MAVVTDNSITKSGSLLLTLDKDQDYKDTERIDQKIEIEETIKSSSIINENRNEEPIILTENILLKKNQTKSIVSPTESINITTTTTTTITTAIEKSCPPKLSHQSISIQLCPSNTRSNFLAANNKCEDAPNILVYKKVCF